MCIIGRDIVMRVHHYTLFVFATLHPRDLGLLTPSSALPVTFQCCPSAASLERLSTFLLCTYTWMDTNLKLDSSCERKHDICLSVLFLLISSSVHFPTKCTTSFLFRVEHNSIVCATFSPGTHRWTFLEVALLVCHAQNSNIHDFARVFGVWCRVLCGLTHMLVMAMFSCFLRTLHADTKSLYQFTFPPAIVKGLLLCCISPSMCCLFSWY